MTSRIALFALALLAVAAGRGDAREERIELPLPVLEDKIRGGLLGQILGNLNGMRHEARYLDEPGEVGPYVPALPDGARTDDDTDIEWVYVLAMEESGTLRLPPEEITGLWREHINRRIWSANQYARQLMDLGLDPPLTGHTALNPWSPFNLAGQFLCETFALMSPALPRSASELALHYVHVAVDGEPAQTTQLFATMIATAFTVSDIDALLDAGVAATDPRSQVRALVEQVRAWHRLHPEDWRTVRRLIRDAWTHHSGSRQDANGFELNTAATVAALLYGEGDFTHTLRLAFALGWDADNNAAIAGTILGVVKGRRWMDEQGWVIADRYHNTTRDGLPRDETLTRFGDRLVRLARRVVEEEGGTLRGDGESAVVSLPRQTPASVEPLVPRQTRIDRLRLELAGEVGEAIAGGDARGRDLARAAYLAICLDLAPELQRRHPARWQEALAALERIPQIAQVLHHRSRIPAAERLQEKATAAGLEVPETEEPLWTQSFDLYDSNEDPALVARPLAERSRSYHERVRQAFAVANIDDVIVETLRLHRVASETRAVTDRAAELLRRLERTPPRDARRAETSLELEEALAAWLPTERLEASADSPSLAPRLLHVQRTLASGQDVGGLGPLADEVEETGRALLDAATEVRRGVEFGVRAPIVEGLERVGEELQKLLPSAGTNDGGD